jgi:hypothetical protein
LPERDLKRWVRSLRSLIGPAGASAARTHRPQLCEDGVAGGLLTPFGLVRAGAPKSALWEA